MFPLQPVSGWEGGVSNAQLARGAGRGARGRTGVFEGLTLQYHMPPICIRTAHVCPRQVHVKPALPDSQSPNDGTTAAESSLSAAGLNTPKQNRMHIFNVLFLADVASDKYLRTRGAHKNKLHKGNPGRMLVVAQQTQPCDLPIPHASSQSNTPT